MRDWDLDTYHSLTFRLPTWSVPTAILDTDFWACHSCKLAHKYFCLASVFRIYFTAFSGYSMAYRKTKTKNIFIKCLTTSYYFIYKWKRRCTWKYCWGWCCFSIVFIYKNGAVSLAKTKIYCCNIAVILAQCFRTGGDLLYLLSGGIWPREAKIKQHVIQSCCRTRHLSSACDLV